MKTILLVLAFLGGHAFADIVGNGGNAAGGGGDYSQYSSEAQRCGETKQAQCTPDKTGGKTMCGRAVSEMVQCMAQAMGKSCDGKCGNGKDFVECDNGQMKTCGYEKLSPTDERCKKPGAVLAYTSSPTERGRLYGHVEFVCGEEKYCSIYTQEHQQPWPREMADGCWFPAGGGASI